MDTRNASALTKVTNLSSNLAAMATFVLTGNVNSAWEWQQALLHCRELCWGQGWW